MTWSIWTKVTAVAVTVGSMGWGVGGCGNVGTNLTGAGAMVAGQFIRVQYGDSLYRLNGQAAGKSPKLVYGGTTYVQLYSIQQALRKAGFQTNWNGSTNPGVFDLVTTAKAAQPTFTFANLVLRDDGGGDAEVDGIATNHDKATHSASLIVSFFDTSGKLIGTGNGYINDLSAGGNITFQTMSQIPYASVATFKVEVQTMM